MTSRRGRRRGRLGGARIVRIAAAAAVALFVGWWTIQAAAVNALVRSNPFAAAAIAAGDPRTATSLAMIEFLIRNGRVSPAAEQRAIAALNRSALADEPFLLAAVAAQVRDDDRRAESLLTEARRRNPRARFTRLLLLNLYLRHGRSEEAGAELATLGRLVPEAGGVLVPELSRLAVDPKTRPGLAKLLRRNPEMRDLTLANLAGAPGNTDLVLGLAAETGSGRDPAHPPQWQSTLLTKLVREGDVERAYRLWQAATRVAGDPSAKGVYDASFAGAPGAPPFNWELTSDADGTAERSHGGLQVDYYGRAAHVLARQLLILKPGAYRLAFRAEGAAKGEGTRLAWTLTCLDGKTGLLNLPLIDVSSAPKAFAAGFIVPAGCRAQWLRLEGAPGDVAAEQNATVSKFELVPGGGR